MLPDISVAAALKMARGRLEERADIAEWSSRDANLLLGHTLGCSREMLMAHPERILTSVEAQMFSMSIEERLRGVPVQYLRGVQEFYGREFDVVPGVLIPRPETELIITEALEYIDKDAPVTIADVGCGSGAIAVTLAAELPKAHVLALDISHVALEMTTKNAAKHGVADRVTVAESDLLAAVAPGIDCIVSNPPYIAETERESLHVQVRDFEPAEALFGGQDGFDVYRKLMPQIWEKLRPGGLMLLEIGRKDRALNWHLNAFEDVYYIDDLQGLPRIVVGTKRT